MESWTFSTVISAQEVSTLLEQQQVVLQLDGVDTYADVIVNGEKVFETINFHRFVAYQQLCLPSTATHLHAWVEVTCSAQCDALHAA